MPSNEKNAKNQGAGSAPRRPLPSVPGAGAVLEGRFQSQKIAHINVVFCCVLLTFLRHIVNMPWELHSRW